MGPSIKVLYIVGVTRSGTTLLDTLLGEVPGFFSTGELRYLWERGLVGDGVCGCARPFTECEVWSRVLAERFGRGAVVDPRAVIRWQREAVRVRHTWNILRLSPERLRGGEPVASYARVVERLYRAIADVTGCRVVVDSSKMPSDAALLSRLGGVDPFFVQVVRDPRGVVHSWRRVKPDRTRSSVVPMPRWSPVKSSVNWLEINLAAEAVRRRNGRRFTMVRYEDLARAPRDTVASLVRFVGEDAAALPFTGPHVATVGENHSVSGNPSRFVRGTLAITEDREWVGALPWAETVLATTVALPLLRRYGYPIASR